jgi:cob(I)alamin adenosyltransferase
MKIYTGRGDNGTAGLLSGERISKSHERIEALGDIDELTSALGIVRMSIRVPRKNKIFGIFYEKAPFFRHPSKKLLHHG